MCSAASNANAGLPNKWFRSFVTQANASPISTLSGIRARRRATAEKLPYHFHQNRGNDCKKTGQQACCRRFEAPQNSIGGNDQQRVAPNELKVYAGRDLRSLRPRLSDR